MMKKYHTNDLKSSDLMNNMLKNYKKFIKKSDKNEKDERKSSK